MTLQQSHSKKFPQGDSTIIKKGDNGKKNAAGIKKADNRKTEKLGSYWVYSFLFGDNPGNWDSIRHPCNYFSGL